MVPTAAGSQEVKQKWLGFAKVGLSNCWKKNLSKLWKRKIQFLVCLLLLQKWILNYLESQGRVGDICWSIRLDGKLLFARTSPIQISWIPINSDWKGFQRFFRQQYRFLRDWRDNDSFMVQNQLILEPNKIAEATFHRHFFLGINIQFSLKCKQKNVSRDQCSRFFSCKFSFYLGLDRVGHVCWHSFP